VLGLLGTVLAITDSQGRNVPQRPQELNDLVANCRREYARLAAAHPRLARYTADANANIAAHPGAFLTANLQELVYYVMSLPPFDGWAADPVRRIRLARITALIESFASMPVPGYPNASRGRLRASTNFPGDVLEQWSFGFYQLFFGYLSRTGLDEEEDEDVIAPSGMVPIMTMHQSKGLQFPFVFVGHMGEAAYVSVSHQLETSLSQFPTNPTRSFARRPPSPTLPRAGRW
jgi:DNA helicase-2/ATP-dependent DNA helicase PcrA